MNTRSTSDKTEVDDLYKKAIDTEKRKAHDPKTSTSGSSISFTIIPEKKKQNFCPVYTESSDSITKLPENTLVPPFDDSSDEIITLAGLNANKPADLDDINLVDLDNENSTNVEKMANNNNPFATLKYAVEAVPFFDGQNIPLTYFIEGCEEAKAMLPSEAEPQFTKIIRTRIVGEARRTIQDENFNSISELTKYLGQVYGRSKNVYQLQGELGCIYQKTGEDVVTYANRLKLLGKQILEAHKNSGSALPVSNFKSSLEKDMCKCFIRGLKSDIEQRIARDLDVHATVSDALRIERELSDITDLRRGEGNNSEKVQNTNRSQETCQICYKEGHSASACRKLTQQPYNKSPLGTEILICQICKKRGHSADKCRFRDPTARQPINIIRETNITCQLCSKPGHNAKSCFTNKNNNLNKPLIVCQWCDKSGHSANNCWKNQNVQRNTSNNPKVTCQICNNFGHIARDCRSQSKRNTVSKDPLFCRYCKGEGHLLDNCELRVANNNRRQTNSQGNSNGPSKSGVQQGSERISHPSTSQKTQ